MRRVTITVFAASILLAFGPASALASHHHRSGRHHHARRHHARIRRFGDVNAPTSSSSADNAGTVQSFKNGVLTIKLNDAAGTTVSGAVTNDTELECMAPEQSQTVHEDGDGGSGDDNSGSDDNQSAGDDQGDAAEQNENQAEDQNENQAEDQNENEAAEENENEAENNCSTMNLTAGTVVREAELRISSAGSTWKKVELES
jgi:hypothetical protein